MIKITFGQVKMGQAFSIEGRWLVKVSPLVGVPDKSKPQEGRAVVYPRELVLVKPLKKEVSHVVR